jgi:tetratricopeptide (TPR) repeat protein
MVDSISNSSSHDIKQTFFPIIAITACVVLTVWLVRSPSSILPVQSSVSSQTQSLTPSNSPMDQEIKKLENFIESHPDSSDAILLLAHLYQDFGQYQKAISAYLKYLEEKPKNADARIDLGVSYFQSAFEDTVNKAAFLNNAIGEMEEAIRYSPEHQLGHFNLGVVYLQTGGIEKANQYFQKCISLNPQSNVAKKAKEILAQHLQIQSNKIRKDN